MRNASRRRKAILAVALASCAILNTGCWNRVEINDIGISIAAALDTAPNHRVRFSEQIALPGRMSGGRGASAENKPYFTFSGVGLDLGDAMQNIQQHMSRELFLAHRRIFLISEDIARENLKKYLDEVSRNPQSRLRTSIAITRGKAYPYLRTQFPFETIPAEGLRKVLFGVSSNYRMDLKQLMIMLASPTGDAYVPMIKMETPSPHDKPNFTANGIVVFHQGRMVGELNDELANGVLWLRKQLKTDTLTTTIPKHPGKISCEMMRSQTKYKVTMKNGHPAIDVNITPEGTVWENNTDLNLDDPNAIDLVEEMFSRQTKTVLEEALHKLQHDYDADIVDFGERVHHAFPKQWPALVKHWDQEFANMPVTVQVDWKIRRVGMTGSSTVER
ncbi:Ger(x)C family spore germination protein [Tumebacillus sp. ITR2]|uniref:Ger(X)C family spore germination protein n=1 Tax=Tumebacillus amylolyticus TaxID=2801339 RepID=A0ABS1J7Y5_9BACL|nr:Ger(x)C family spore germination protein [Tumebacillus amylolyticus]